MRRAILLVPVIGGTCLVLAAVVLVIVLVVRRAAGPQAEHNPGIPLELTRAAPRAGTATPTPPTGTQDACVVSVGSDDAQQPVPLPVSLTIESRVFPVVATLPSGGRWGFPEGYPGAAAWVCGSVVNYLLQLEDTPDSRAVLESLAPGGSLALRLSNGTDLRFRVGEKREVKAYDPATLAQARPSLTLILPLAEDAWQIVTAEYAAEAETSTAPVNALAQPNQPVQVGDVRVTVSHGHIVRTGIALQPGTVAYVVEFTLQNTGAEALRADDVVMKLQDGSGNWYLPSFEASAVGERGPFVGELAPGATTSASVGYLVPETLTGPTLLWTFAPQADAVLLALVAIPYESGPAAAAEGQFTAAVTDAFLTADRRTLIIEGEIRNTGQTPVTISLQQISLTSSAGLSVLQMAAPPLPWTVQPGQTQVVELQYARPDAPTALLTLAGYSFEIQGLD